MLLDKLETIGYRNKILELQFFFHVDIGEWTFRFPEFLTNVASLKRIINLVSI